MTPDQKLEAVKSDLDQLFDMVDRNERAITEFAEQADRAFKQLSAELSDLRQALSKR